MKNIIKKLEVKGITLEVFATIISDQEIDYKELSYAKWK